MEHLLVTSGAQRDAQGAGPPPGHKKRRLKKRCKSGRFVDEVTTEELLALTHLPSDKAASRVGLGITAFKKLCRRRGIQRWPFAKQPSSPFPEAPSPLAAAGPSSAWAESNTNTADASRRSSGGGGGRRDTSPESSGRRLLRAGGALPSPPWPAAAAADSGGGCGSGGGGCGGGGGNRTPCSGSPRNKLEVLLSAITMDATSPEPMCLGAQGGDADMAGEPQLAAGPNLPAAAGAGPAATQPATPVVARPAGQPGMPAATMVKLAQALAAHPELMGQLQEAIHSMQSVQQPVHAPLPPSPPAAAAPEFAGSPAAAFHHPSLPAAGRGVLERLPSRAAWITQRTDSIRSANSAFVPYLPPGAAPPPSPATATAPQLPTLPSGGSPSAWAASTAPGGYLDQASAAFARMPPSYSAPAVLQQQQQPGGVPPEAQPSFFPGGGIPAALRTVSLSTPAIESELATDIALVRRMLWQRHVARTVRAAVEAAQQAGQPGSQGWGPPPPPAPAPLALRGLKGPRPPLAAGEQGWAPPPAPLLAQGVALPVLDTQDACSGTWAQIARRIEQLRRSANFSTDVAGDIARSAC